MNLYINNFSIRISDNTDDELFSNKGKTLKIIKSDTSIFRFDPTVIIADPFLFNYKNELYLFYESQKKWYGKGKLCMIKTSNLKDWSKEKIILKEPIHLSFPFVFEYADNLYMIPETGQDGSIRIYENKDKTLENWNLKAKIIDDGKNWVDSSLIFDDGKFYLFSTQMEFGQNYKQFLFVSDSITGPYKEHPKSPIYVGNDYGRNAGSIFKFQDKWMRPTQDCQGNYGDNVSVFAIDILSETDYKESLYKNNIFHKTGVYKDGGHQFNFIEFNNRIIVATDYMKKNYNIIEFTRRLLKKIIR